MFSIEIVRKRTAISRSGFSRPIRFALEAGLINPSVSVFDYGCGKGQDIVRLNGISVNATGWDPAFLPNGVKKQASVVNLGYVINVIEENEERIQVLNEAWCLANDLLIVAARTTLEKAQFSEVYSDGYITSRNTFQKMYTQSDLYNLLKATTSVEPVAVAPGIFFIFRNKKKRYEYLVNKMLYRSRPSRSKKITHQDLNEEDTELFQGIVQFFDERGRLPKSEDECQSNRLIRLFGNSRKLLRALYDAQGSDWLEESKQRKKNDIVVYLALLHFRNLPRMSEYPKILQNDIKAHYGSYNRAKSEATELLYAIGSKDLIAGAINLSPVGKKTRDALYLHESALHKLPPILRVFEGCARVISGEIEGASIIKISQGFPRVSYLCYPKFNSDPHPKLSESVVVSIDNFQMHYRDYRKSSNPPILHRKEEFVSDSYPGKTKFLRLTRSEERHGLYKELSRIGYLEFWENLLREKKLKYRGHRIESIKD